MTKLSIIIGDAGGTGTQWRIVEGDRVASYETIGFNAYTHNLQDFKTSIHQTFGDKIEAGTLIYLYAAGVDTDSQKEEVCSSLKSVFGERIHLANDLVGAARSLCGKEKGNVCILGTGSNACFYNGETVNKVSASLGYVLGDEGSGAYMGKKLMMGVFREHFSREIIELFDKAYHLSSHEAIQRIYHQPRPNHFLASFAEFVSEHRKRPEIYNLIKKAFNDFFEAFFKDNKYTEYPFYFSGSIAFHFSDILKEVGKERGFDVQNIVQSPIDGLVLYHKQYG